MHKQGIWAHRDGIRGALAGLLVWLAPLAWAVEAETDDFMAQIDQGREGPGLEKGSVVVVPIPVSNPTLGSGLQLAALYLHPSRSGEDGPNPTTGVGAMYTDTESWVAGLFHQDFLFDDRLRFTAAAGAGSLNLKFYGFGGDGLFARYPLDYSMDMAVGFARAQYRLPGTEHWFAGPGLLYSEGRVEMKLDSLVPGLPGLGKDVALGAGGLIVSYDSRDSNYYPTEGVNFSASWYDFSESFASDFDYAKTRLSLSHYLLVGSKWVIAMNGEMERTAGDAPFFSESALAVRGYNRGRYMSDVALTGHLESRYKFHPRWMLMTFVDYGWINDSANQIFEGRTAHSVGGGLHWQTTKDKPLHLGFDVAYTEEDDAVFFIQLGERF